MAPPRLRKNKREKKSKIVQILEFVPVYLAFHLSTLLPLRAGHLLSQILGSLFYYVVSRRRRIAIENLRHVFHDQKTTREIRVLARLSYYSFVASVFETAKFVTFLNSPQGKKRIQATQEGLGSLFEKARNIHQRAKGCIFVTPHIGNWEFLPFVSFSIGIPLVIVARPLDNPYLEKWLFAHREASGQVIVPKTNSIYLLRRALRQGKSIGMLPDQSTMRAISVDYLGRKATTTPIPALLAILYKRPIVVVACCRKSKDFRFEAFVSDPIWPEIQTDEKTEIFRMTELMNSEMEAIIRRYPEQYFWVHDRWKRYQTKREISPR
jgi:KDO2-lipid IV(A) lauroyltransferase